jgi:hypothetical protein
MMRTRYIDELESVRRNLIQMGETAIQLTTAIESGRSGDPVRRSLSGLRKPLFAPKPCAWPTSRAKPRRWATQAESQERQWRRGAASELQSRLESDHARRTVAA